MAEYKSKHGIVSRPPYELYMSFADMRNFLRFLPEDKREGVTADYDTLKASVQGFPIGVKITERTPYSRIILWDDGAPFHFTAEFHFDAANDAYKTEFYIILNAELNLMMKMMLGSRLQQALDKVVDSLVDVSEGRMPEGFDPSQFGMQQ